MIKLKETYLGIRTDLRIFSQSRGKPSLNLSINFAE